MARAACRHALDKKGLDIKILDMRGCSDVADYFVICSGTVDVHVRAIADNIVEGLSKQGINVWHKEGYKALEWVLLDYIGVVVHVFQPQVRQRYALEKLWADAPAELIG